MGRISIFLGIVLILVAVAAMILLFAVEQIQFVEDFMVDLHCEAGETDIVTAQRLNFSGTQNSSTVFFCTNNENLRREITGAYGATIAGAFVVPFLLGMFMAIGGSFVAAGNSKRRIAQMVGVNPSSTSWGNVEVYGSNLENADLSPEQRQKVQSILQAIGGATTSSASSSSLSERLQQLEEARNQGLISSAEYQRTRQAILDSMDDNL